MDPVVLPTPRLDPVPPSDGALPAIPIDIEAIDAGNGIPLIGGGVEGPFAATLAIGFLAHTLFTWINSQKPGEPALG